MRRMHSRRTGAVAARPDDMVIETRHDRRALIADAGIGRVSLISIVAGTLVAFGAFVVMLAAIAKVPALIVAPPLCPRLLIAVIESVPPLMVVPPP